MAAHVHERKHCGRTVPVEMRRTLCKEAHPYEQRAVTDETGRQHDPAP